MLRDLFRPDERGQREIYGRQYREFGQWNTRNGTVKITKISLHPVVIPRHSGIVSRHAIVEIETDTGVTGIGEMSDFGHLPMYVPDLGDLEKQLNTRLRGEDPRRRSHIANLLFEMYPEQMYIYDMGSVIRCGVDIAVHDLIARTLGISVCELLGGRLRDRIEVCYPIFRMTSGKEIEPNLEAIARRLEEGISLFRYYYGRDFGVDEKFLSAMRKRFGDRVRLKSLDASNLLKAKDAIRALQRFQEYDFLITESPCHRYDFEGTALVRRSIPQPVSEHIFSYSQAVELLRSRAVDIFNVALTFIGGFTPAMKVFGLAEAAGISALLGTTQELCIGTAAQAQAAAVVPNLDFPGDTSGPRVYREDVVTHGIVYDGNMMVVPEGPGLGMEIDRAKLERATGPLAIGGESVLGTLDRTPQ